MMKKRIVSLVLATCMVASMSVTAFAATQEDVDNSVGDGGNANGVDKSSTTVNISIEASTLSIGDGNIVSLNVPSVLPMIFAADGQNFLPTNWAITNHDPNTAIDLIGVKMTGNEVDGHTWALSAPDTDMKSLPANSCTMTFKMGKNGEPLTPIDIGDNQVKMVMDAAQSRDDGNSQLFDFEIERTAFTEAMNVAGAFSMELQFGFHT